MVKKILISSFDAFGERKVNNSRTIANLILSQAKEQNFKGIIEHIELATVYDQAASQILAKTRVMLEQPELVISFGEAKVEKIQLETRAHDSDNASLADNIGEVRQNVKEAPSFLNMTLPVQQIFNSISFEDKELVQISDDAGAFVCNNTAYGVLAQNPDFLYGFIHVPVDSSKNEKLVAILIKILSSQLD